LLQVSSSPLVLFDVATTKTRNKDPTSLLTSYFFSVAEYLMTLNQFLSSPSLPYLQLLPRHDGLGLDGSVQVWKGPQLLSQLSSDCRRSMPVWARLLSNAREKQAGYRLFAPSFVSGPIRVYSLRGSSPKTTPNMYGLKIVCRKLPFQRVLTNYPSRQLRLFLHPSN
jgi:hypothetical protein